MIMSKSLKTQIYHEIRDQVWHNVNAQVSGKVMTRFIMKYGIRFVSIRFVIRFLVWFMARF
jgi:hypothetical protein